MPLPAVELTVRKGPEPETFEFLSRSGPEPPVPHTQAVFTALARSARQALEALSDVVSPPPWQPSDERLVASRLDEVAQSLRALMPAGVRQLLDELEGRSLVLVNRTDLPWELAVPAGVPVRLAGSEPDPELTGEPRRALLVVDPEDLIPGASQAADRFEEALLGCSVERLEGAEATLGALRRAWSRGRFGLVAFWAYAQGPSLRLADGLLDRREAGRMRASEGPRLVVVMPVQQGLARWGSLFAEAGVPSVLSARWTLEPGDLLARTWGRFNAGVPLEEALPGRALLLEGPSLTADQLRACRLVQPATLDAPLSPAFLLKIVDGPQAGREIPLFTQMLKRPLVLGRPGPRANDIDLEDGQLSNQALSLEAQGSALVLTNLSPDRDKVLVNGLATTSAVLEGGEEIAVGDSLLLLERAGAAASAAGKVPARRYAVRVVEGSEEDLSRRLELESKVAVVGRLPDCALTLSDPAVSRQHVSFIARDGAYYLSPVGSRPTVLNGVELEGEKELRPGDRITLSPTTTLEFVEC